MEREENIERLIQTLKDDDELVQTQAVGLLEEIGEPAVELLLVSAGDKDKEIRLSLIHISKPHRQTPWQLHRQWAPMQSWISAKSS